MSISQDNRGGARISATPEEPRLPQLDKAVDRYALKVTGELTRHLSSLGRTLLHPEAREVDGFESATLIHDAGTRIAKRLAGGAFDKATLAEAQDMLRRVETFTKSYKEQFSSRNTPAAAAAPSSDSLESLSMPKHPRS